MKYLVVDCRCSFLTPLSQCSTDGEDRNIFVFKKHFCIHWGKTVLDHHEYFCPLTKGWDLTVCSFLPGFFAWLITALHKVTQISQSLQPLTYERQVFGVNIRIMYAYFVLALLEWHHTKKVRHQHVYLLFRLYSI